MPAIKPGDLPPEVWARMIEKAKADNSNKPTDLAAIEAMIHQGLVKPSKKRAARVLAVEDKPPKPLKQQERRSFRPVPNGYERPGKRVKQKMEFDASWLLWIIPILMYLLGNLARTKGW